MVLATFHVTVQSGDHKAKTNVVRFYFPVFYFKKHFTLLPLPLCRCKYDLNKYFLLQIFFQLICLWFYAFECKASIVPHINIMSSEEMNKTKTHARMFPCDFR